MNVGGVPFSENSSGFLMVGVIIAAITIVVAIILNKKDMF